MLRDSEVRDIAAQTKAVLLQETSLPYQQVDLLLLDISSGNFNQAFRTILTAIPFWKFAAKRRCAKAVRRLLVPEYMEDLLALRRLCGLLEEGYCLRRKYVVWEEADDIISTMNWPMDHDKINYSLWRRFLNCIGSSATADYVHTNA